MAVGAERRDAKLHRDVGALRKIVVDALGHEWLALSSQGKLPEAFLFAPCLSKEEVQFVFDSSKVLSPAQIHEASSFWSDVVLTSFPAISDAIGEIFFEVPPDGYRLEPLRFSTEEAL